MNIDLQHLEKLTKLQSYINKPSKSLEDALFWLNNLALEMLNASFCSFCKKTIQSEPKQWTILHPIHSERNNNSVYLENELPQHLPAGYLNQEYSKHNPSENLSILTVQLSNGPSYKVYSDLLYHQEVDTVWLIAWSEEDFARIAGRLDEIRTLIAYFTELMNTMQQRHAQPAGRSRIDSFSQHGPEYLGASLPTKNMLAIADRIATTDTTVLIYGESGVGKEVLADRIHQNSLRANQAFLKINCAAVPDNLLESELFGHRKGAFTNAVQNRKGKFLSANKGTIFLDEIGEMSLQLQAKMLRVLQNKTIEPVGSDESVDVDVRIIAATNRNLMKLIQENKFREDLYYRLHVLPVHILPLRERKPEILELASHFLDTFKWSLQRQDIEGFSESAKFQLEEYSWPGNVRELQNVIQRGIIMAKEPIIEPHDLDLADSQEEKSGAIHNSTDQSIESISTNASGTTASLKERLTQCKRLIISTELRYNKWNLVKTSNILRIQRTYLSRLLKELNIDRST